MDCEDAEADEYLKSDTVCEVVADKGYGHASSGAAFALTSCAKIVR